MRVLNRFETEAEWAESELEYPDVAGIEEDNRMEYLTPPDPYETPGGIVLWDAEKEQKVVVLSDDYSTTKYPEETFTPIGVLVIPASHMDDGKARMMSTRWMNCDEPENGSLTAQQMSWGYQYVSGIPERLNVPIISSSTNQVIGGISDYGHLSSNFSGYTGASNPQDPGTRWEENDGLVASPYASDGTPNPNYRATSYSGGSISNPLADFDGKRYTNRIIADRGSENYGSWKPTYDNHSDNPAASCCDMYHTVGTKQGDWYLPTAGELGYLVARLGNVTDTMKKIGGLRGLEGGIVHSSSVVKAQYTYVTFLNTGGIGSTHSLVLYSVIAFSLV